MVDENLGRNPDAHPHEDGEAKAFAKKFNISLDLAKRLTGLHRAALALELHKPKKRYP
jgi:hypothetical protein